MDDTPDSFVSTLLFIWGDLWKLVAIVAAVIGGYVFLHMALGVGVEAWIESRRRRRESSAPAAKSELDS